MCFNSILIYQSFQNKLDSVAPHFSLEGTHICAQFPESFEVKFSALPQSAETAALRHLLSKPRSFLSAAFF